MMTHEKARAIAAEHAPKLLIDVQHPELKDMFCVRATPGGAPFSIHLASHLHQDLPDVDAQERKTLTDALDAACKMLGVA